MDNAALAALGTRPKDDDRDAKIDMRGDVMRISRVAVSTKSPVEVSTSLSRLTTAGAAIVGGLQVFLP